MTLITQGTVSYGTALNTQIEDMINRGIRTINVPDGVYYVTAPVSVSVDDLEIVGFGLPRITIEHSNSVGFLSVSDSRNTVIRGIEVYKTLPASGQTWIKFNTGCTVVKIYDCRFIAGPPSYQDISLASSSTMLDLEGVAGKDVQNCEFLPYEDMICLKLSSGFGANVCNNRFYNGLLTHLEDLVGATYPSVRPCKMAIAMYDEEHGNVDHNQFWGLGMAQTTSTAAVPMDAVIYYERIDFSKETGHMDLSDNQIEMCYAPKLIWTKGLRFSKINNNNTGVGQVNSGFNGTTRPITDGTTAAASEGDGSVVVEGLYFDATAFGLGFVPYDFTTGETFYHPSDYITMSGNNLHNPGTGNEAAAIFLRFVDDVCIESNHITRLFCQYGIRIHDNCKRVVIRNTSLNYDSANNATSQIPVEIRSYETISSPIVVPRTCKDIVCGEISSFNADSAELVVTRELINNAAFTDTGTGGNLTKTGAFTNYVFSPGDTFTLISATGGTIVTTPIAISSKTNDNTIVLAADIFSGSGNGTAVYGYITYQSQRNNIYTGGIAPKNKTISGLAFTDSGRTLTKTGAFVDYVVKTGDTFTAISGTPSAGTLVTTPVTISSKTNNDTIVLASDLTTSNGDVSSLTGYVISNNSPLSTSPLRFFVAAGNTAGADISMTGSGITIEDTVIGVLCLDRNGTAANINFVQVPPSEATIMSTDVIRLSTTNTSGDALWIIWHDKSAAYTTNIRPSA